MHGFFSVSSNSSSTGSSSPSDPTNTPAVIGLAIATVVMLSGFYWAWRIHRHLRIAPLAPADDSVIEVKNENGETVEVIRHYANGDTLRIDPNRSEISEVDVSVPQAQVRPG